MEEMCGCTAAVCIYIHAHSVGMWVCCEVNRPHSVEKPHKWSVFFQFYMHRLSRNALCVLCMWCGGGEGWVGTSGVKVRVRD